MTYRLKQGYLFHPYGIYYNGVFWFFTNIWFLTEPFHRDDIFLGKACLISDGIVPEGQDIYRIKHAF